MVGFVSDDFETMCKVTAKVEALSRHVLQVAEEIIMSRSRVELWSS
jgi:hypothetical protein